MANKQQSSNEFLSTEQIGAIKRKIELGLVLKENFPEVADLYRSGHYTTEIAKMYQIQEKYNVSEGIAIGAISYAISGYNGSYISVSVNKYEGLITDELELEKIAENHWEENGRDVGLAAKLAGRGIHALTKEDRIELGSKGGKKSYEEKLGIHSRTAEQHILDSKKGGEAAAKVNYLNNTGFYNPDHEIQRLGGLITGKELGTKMRDEKRGVHALTSAELSIAAKKGSTKALEVKGLTAWSDSEIAETFKLRSQGLEALDIANKINELFHNSQEIRNRNGVYSILRRKNK